MNTNWGNLASKVNQGFGQVRQFAVEKLGTADPECITELPADYLQLEHKLDKVKILYESFHRLANHHFVANDYDPTVTESMREAVGRFNEMIIRPAASQLQHAVSPPQSQASPTSPKEELPKSFAHALARTSSESALALGENEPLGAALKKYSAAQDQIGNARVRMESDVYQKFIMPWSSTLDINIQSAIKAKRQVQLARLDLDSAKTRMKNAKLERLPQAQIDLSKAEDDLNDAIKDATHKIHLVVDSPEPLRNIADLVNAQMAYFKSCYDTLSQFAPEIDELQVTQEALFRSGS